MASTIQQPGCHVALEQIRVPENVRALDQTHVHALGGSIKVQGILVLLVVREHPDGFVLVAGFHRLAAARSLGRSRSRSSCATPTGRRPTGGGEHHPYAAQPL